MDLVCNVDIALVPRRMREVGKEGDERAAALAHVPIDKLLECEANPARTIPRVLGRVGRVDEDAALC